LSAFTDNTVVAGMSFIDKYLENVQPEHWKQNDFAEV